MTRGQMSSYICVARGAQVGLVDEFGRRHTHTFRRYNSNHSDRKRDSFEVPKGMVIPMGFSPSNDSAKEDRKQQINNPVSFIETSQDKHYLAELLWKEGLYRTKQEALQWLDNEIEKLEKEVVDIPENIPEQKWLDAIARTYNNEKIRIILDQNTIPYSDRAKHEQLVKKLYKAALFDEIEVRKNIR